MFIGIAIGIAAAAYRAYKQGRKTVATIVLGAAAAAYATFQGTSDELLTLYSIDESGSPDLFGETERASPSVGIYLAGVGGLMAVAGGFQMRGGPARTEGAEGPERTKTCPDCAETVLAAARVCKHCGSRFEPGR